MLEFVREYLPIVIIGAVIGTFALLSLLVYAALKKKGDTLEKDERHIADAELIHRLLVYAKPHWKSFVAVL